MRPFPFPRVLRSDAVSKTPAKRIVLTGISRGLGLAMAEQFIERGHTVFGCARSAKSLDSLRSRWPTGHRFDAVDVADDGQVAAWAKTVFEAADGVDLLINNAALMNRNAPLWKISADEFSALVDVNIKGVANVIRHFVPRMVQRRAGIIVNFSSGWGRSTSPEVAPYCATKWAVEGLSQALAQELPEGMAAVALNPGIIDTDMLRSCFGDSAGSYPDADQWAHRAVPYILNIGAPDSGRPLVVPSC
jgi:NAD(P)-dependent dehydrogenase (short-subunit alcohol dehydrogenase family)